MNVEIYYEPLKFQDKFHASIKPKCYLSAGYGAGKTYSLCMKMFQLCAINHGMPGGMLVPDLKMFKRDVLPTIREICADNGIKYKYHKTEYYFHFPTTNTTVYVFHAQDEGRSIRGPNLAFMCINECSLISQTTFNAAIGRVRLKEAPLLQIAMSGTPEEFNWIYEYFVESPRDDTDFIYGNMKDNFHVHENYYDMLVESYDDQLIEQFVEGKFVSLTGKRAARKFDRRKHVVDSIDMDPFSDVWVSMDFNVDPMAATLWSRVYDDPHPLQAFDEICIPNSDTYEMCDAIKERIPIEQNVIIFPDPAGIARSTKARGKSDISILKTYGKFEDIRFKSRISVRDCLNALNNQLGKDRMLFSKKCKQTIADMEQCKIKEGTFSEIDKKNPKRTHWLDGIKNMVDHAFPIQAKTRHWVRKIR